MKPYTFPERFVTSDRLSPAHPDRNCSPAGADEFRDSGMNVEPRTLGSIVVNNVAQRRGVNRSAMPATIEHSRIAARIPVHGPLSLR